MTWLRNALWRVFPTFMIAMVVFIAGFFFGSQSRVGFAQDWTEMPEYAREAFQSFWQAFNLIEDEYIDDVPIETLVDGAISGMVNSLGDEFSSYMDPELFPLLNQDLEGEIVGIGVVIRTNDDNEVEVVGLIEGGPAERAGVLPGDVFVEVDGQDMTGLSQAELATYVRGPEGSSVNIVFRREGELVEFDIVRERIIIPNVESEVVDGDLGYVRLNNFSPDARVELEDAIDALNPDELTGLIIDLRGNPGGLLTSAIDVASLLIPEGTVLIEDFGDREERLNARGDSVDFDVPIVVLVDETSASASELVAGAWQDYDLVTIMGEGTFGKGTVQTWYPLVNGGGVRVTIARWLTPNRHWIHEKGIIPDIEVLWNPMTAEEQADDLQLRSAIAFLRGEELPQPVVEPTSPATP
ncbi:MAG: S41 family peptidase [Chloroflexota bacterium]|nr:S41 family peptidase [Chloroflexota bacterium]